MGDLGDLLELLYDARSRWRTAHLTHREWQHVGRLHEAIERLNLNRAGGTSQVMSSSDARGPEPTELEFAVRTWLDGERAREERAGPFVGSSLGIRDGERWWQYNPGYGASSNEQEPGMLAGIGEAALSLLDPAHVLGALRLEPAGELEAAGRHALVVRGRPRGPDDGHRLHRLGIGAEEYELLVDRERGVLLRTTSLFDGEPLSVHEVLEVAFDEDFAPGTFVFELPEGETFVEAFPRPQNVTLEQAVGLAPFAVLSPAEVPDDWQRHVLFLPGGERPPLPPSVNLHYHSRDASQQLNIAQTATGAADQREWLVWERDGDLLVAGPAKPHGLEPGYARVERHGTRATLSSAELPRERIAAVARSLCAV